MYYAYMVRDAENDACYKGITYAEDYVEAMEKIDEYYDIPTNYVTIIPVTDEACYDVDDIGDLINLKDEDEKLRELIRILMGLGFK